jgi:hypothetical protein
MQRFFFFVLFLVCCFGTSLSAQFCTAPTAYRKVYLSGLRFNCNSLGDLGGFGQVPYLFEPVAGAAPSTIWYADVWYGGYTSAQELRVRANRFRYNSSFWTGPIPAGEALPGASCANWDTIFEVHLDDIEAFLVDFSDGFLQLQHPAIRNWPGRNNPLFESYWGFPLPPDTDLAPFHDENGDGNYNYYDGDYPVVKMEGRAEFIPTLLTWTVQNDNSGLINNPEYLGIGAEIQVTSFLTECPANPLLNNTLFRVHKLINRSSDTLHQFSMGLYVDFDLGYFNDDYVGCHPPTHTFYAYNSDNLDETSQWQSMSYGQDPPVQAVTFLNRPLDRFMHMYSINFGNPFPEATKDPSSLAESFQYLSGRWRDGTPLSYGGSGYNPGSSELTSLAFPDNPGNPNGWSMSALGLTATEVRGVGSTFIDTLLPGQVVELQTAWTYHRAPGNNHLQNVNLMETDVAYLRQLYDNDFADVCQPVPVGTRETPAGGRLLVTPNPSAGAVRISWAEVCSGVLQISDVSGKIYLQNQIQQQNQAWLQLDIWPSGVYFARFQSGNHVWVEKIVLEK